MIEPTYYSFEWISSNTFVGKKSGEGYGIFALDGKTLLDPIFSSIGYGNYEYEFLGDQPSVFYNGIARIEYDKKFGYISEKDYQIIIKPQYEEARPFVDGNAIVQTNSGYGVIDVSNRFLIQPEYGFMTRLAGDLFEVKNNRYELGRWVDETGAINLSGKVLVPFHGFSFSSISVAGDYIVVDAGSEEGLYKRNGQRISKITNVDAGRHFLSKLENSYNGEFWMLYGYDEAQSFWCLGILTSEGELIWSTIYVKGMGMINDTLLATELDDRYGLMVT